MKSIRHFAWALAVLIPLSVTPSALAANVFPGVGSVDYNQGANTLTLVINYKANPYRVQWLSSQRQLVVDVEGMSLPSNRAMYIGMGVVGEIRASRLRAGTTRLLFTLSQAADLRTTTSNGALTLMVFPRGGAPMMSSMGGPGPRPTRRPAPDYNPSVPLYNGRVTPAPVQPSFAPIVVATPTPAPFVMPSARPTFVPTPAPDFTPEPTPTPAAAEGPRDFEVFGSRFVVGAELPLSLTETYPSGNSESSVSFPPGGTINYDQMFGPYFGFGLGTHAIGYNFTDDQAIASGFKVTHKRQDYELNVGPRFRLPLPLGLEMYAQPGFLAKLVTVDSSAQAVDAAGVATATSPTAVSGESYLTSGYTGYGAQIQGGLGYHLGGPLSLALLGEYNALLAGSMNQSTVPTIFPLMGFRAGAEARLDFSFFDLTLGYNLTNYGHADLAQTANGPYLKLGVVY